MTWLIGLLLAGAAYFFTKKKEEQRKLNRAKIPESVLQWEPSVYDAAAEFDVPVKVLFPVLWQESAGNPNARGSAGERGLMQLKEIAVKDLKLRGYGEFTDYKTSPKQNIRAGAAYLALQRTRTDNWFQAIKAYNQGAAGAKQNKLSALKYLESVKAKQPFFNE